MTAKKKKPTKAKVKAVMGRPTAYTNDLADIICERIMIGDSVVTITNDDDMPCEKTFYSWLNKYDYLLQTYTHARAMQQHGAFDRMRDIAADKTLDPADKRVMIDVEKFRIVKLAPKVYGDRVNVDHGVQSSFSGMMGEIYGNKDPELIE